MCGAQTDIATFKMYTDAACTTEATGQENTIIKFQQTGTNKCVHMQGEEVGMALLCKDGEASVKIYNDAACTKMYEDQPGYLWGPSPYTSDEAVAFLTNGGCLQGGEGMWGKLEAPVSAEWGIGCPGGTSVEASGVATCQGMECLREERAGEAGEQETKEAGGQKVVGHLEFFSDEGCTTKFEEASMDLLQTGTPGKCFHFPLESPEDEHGMQVVCENGKTHLKLYSDTQCAKPETKEMEYFDFSEITADDAVLFMTAGKCLKQPSGACHPDDAPCNVWAKLKAPVSADWGQGCAPPAADQTAPTAQAATAQSADGAMLQSMSVSLGLVFALLWQI